MKSLVNLPINPPLFSPSPFVNLSTDPVKKDFNLFNIPFGFASTLVPSDIVYA